MLSYSYYGADRRNYILFGLAYVRRSPGGKPEIVFRWDRIFLVFSLLAVIFWLGASFSFYLFLKHKRNFHEVSFAKCIIFPFRMDDHNREMGKYYIKKGNEEWDKQEFPKAISYLRAGLPRVPDDLEARIRVAKVYSFRPSTSISILEEGLKYNPSEEYLIFLFKTYKQLRFDKEAIETADLLLAQGLNTEKEYLIVNAYKAAFLFLVGKYSEALEIIEQENLYQIPDGLVLKAQMQWGRGEKREAIETLKAALFQYPNVAEAYTILDYYLRSEGLYEEAMRYAILRNTSQPLDHISRVAIMHNHNSQGNVEILEREINSFFDDFIRNEQALLDLGKFAGDAGLPDVSERVLSILEASGSSRSSAVALFHAQALNEANRPEDALAFIQEIANRFKVNDFQEAITSGILALSYLKTNETDVANYNLTQLLESTELRTEDLSKFATLFYENGYYDEAITILEKAYLNAQDNQIVLNLLVKAKIKIGDIENLNQYLYRIFTTMRRPDYELLSSALQLLSSDKYLFSYKRDELLQNIEKLISGKSVDT